MLSRCQAVIMAPCCLPHWKCLSFPRRWQTAREQKMKALGWGDEKQSERRRLVLEDGWLSATVHLCCAVPRAA